MSVSAIQAAKAVLRKEAFAARKLAKTPAAVAAANAELLSYLARFPTPTIFAGYMPIRTEVDPLPAMTALCAAGHKMTVPVIVGQDVPLQFCEWHPDALMVEGPFGARIPKERKILIPDVVIAPLVGFDAFGHRLGYGGGYYDRSIAEIRASKELYLVGFAFAAQKLPAIPVEETDVSFPIIVTENGVLVSVEEN